MSNNPKFLIAEQSGTEFSIPIEYIPDTTDINHISGTTLSAYSQIQAAKYRQIIFATGNPYIAVSGTTLTTLAYFFYEGSSIVQAPSVAYAIAWVTGGTGTVRIQDITNNKTICSANTTATAIPSVLNLGTLSNIPTGQAVWAVQTSVTGILTAIDTAAVMIGFT